MYMPSLSRLAGRSLVLCVAAVNACLCAQTAPAIAPDDTLHLEDYVVSASRSPQDPKLTPSSVTLLPLADFHSAQIGELRTALAETPGVIVANTGATGGQSSIFMRGANSDQTLFVVDGVRLNTSTASYGNFLGGADLIGLDRVEVLRGPQSTLYGSSAMGGVILLETAHGRGAPEGVVSASAGSLGSFGMQVAEQGGTTASDFSFSLGRTQTDNDRPYNKYKNWTYSGRFEEQAASWLLVGATMRGLVGHYEEPGPTTYPSMGDVQSVMDLVTAYAEAKAGEQFTSRLTTAWYQDEYTYNDGSPYDFYYARNTRELLDWQNTWQAAKWAQIVGGVNAERSYYQSGGLTYDRSLAEYLSATLHPTEVLEVTAGLRHDHFDYAGDATTGRAGAAYLLNDSATKLRATYGTGFNAPSPADRYGAPPYILPNPGLRPEKSRGWDIGVDQRILDGRITLEGTYFENRFSDLLEYQVVDPVTYAGRMVNVERATTRGGEFGLTAKPIAALTLRGSYTYLEAMDDTTQQRLIRRPRHTFAIGVEVRPNEQWTMGAGAHLVADRVDGAYGPTPLGGYTTFRAYASYAFRSGLVFKARVENLLNRSYQEVAGYPALPRRFSGAIEWKF